MFAAIAITSLWSLGLSAQTMPVPPCAGSPVPAAGAVGDALNQLVWMEDELPAGWSLPACVGWNAGPTTILLAAAGRFRVEGDSAALTRRLTRISTMTDIVYWSSSRGKWRNLFRQATALSEPDRKSQRSDFVEGDFVPDGELFFWLKEDNPTAGVVYQMLVHEIAPDRLVFETVNLTPLKARLLIFSAEIAAPGEYRQHYYIERESSDIWHYYSLVRLGRAGSLAGTAAVNYRNRAAAYFRYLAGLKMDQEPPAAR